MDNFIIGSGIIFLVPFFTTIGVVAPLKNDPILSSRSIQSFRHLELKNLSIISDFRHRTRMVQQFRSRRSRRSRRSSSRSTVLLEDVIHILATSPNNSCNIFYTITLYMTSLNFLENVLFLRKFSVNILVCNIGYLILLNILLIITTDS